MSVHYFLEIFCLVFGIRYCNYLCQSVFSLVSSRSPPRDSRRANCSFGRIRMCDLRAGVVGVVIYLSIKAMASEEIFPEYKLRSRPGLTTETYMKNETLIKIQRFKI